MGFSGLMILVGTICVSFTSASATCTLKTDTEPTRCGIRATIPPAPLETYAPFAVSKLESKEDCAVLCARRINSDQNGDIPQYGYPFYMSSYKCNAFFFDENAKICQLLSQNLNYASLDRNASHSSKVFYQADCFDCGDLCDQPLYTQLLDNANFEEPGFGPWILRNSRAAPGRKSKYAYQCVGDSFDERERDRCILGQQYNGCDGSLYKIGFDYLASGFYSLDERTFSQSLVISKIPRTDVGKWRSAYTFQKQVKHNDLTAGQLEFQFANLSGIPHPHGLKIDNAWVLRVPNPPPITQGAKNLFVNPGFESGKLQPWEMGSNGTIITPGLNGSNYALQCSSCSISQTVSTTPGKDYYFRFDYRDPGKENVHIKFTFESNSIQNLYDYDTPDKSAEASMPFNAAGSSTKISISVDSQTKAKLTLDNFSVKEIDL